jgi:hypothetical protein
MDALLAHRQYGKYSIAELATALLSLSGQVPDLPLPAGLIGEELATVREPLAAENVTS